MALTTVFDDLHQRVTTFFSAHSEWSRFEVTTTSLTLASPGITVADLTALFTELGGTPDLLPPDFPLADVALRRFSLTNDLLDASPRMSFDVGWAGPPIEIIDGLRFEAADIAVDYRRRQWSAQLSTRLHVGDLTLAASVDLPAMVVSASAHHDDPTPPSFDHPLFTGAQLDELAIVASVPFARAVVHVAASNLASVGPARLRHVEADFIIDADSPSASEASVSIDVDIDLGAAHGDLAASLTGHLSRAGWSIAGILQPPKTLTLGTLVAGLATGGSTKPSLGPLDSLHVDEIDLDLDSAAELVRFGCTVSMTDWPEASLTVTVEHRPNHLDVAGQLRIADLDFLIEFQSDTAAGAAAPDTVIIARFAAGGAHPLLLDDLIAAVGGSVRTGLSLEVRGAIIGLGPNSAMLAAFDVNAGIDLRSLGDLPLVGSLIGGPTPLGLSLQPIYTSGTWSASDVAIVRAAAPAGIRIPDVLVPDDVSVSAQLNLAGRSIDLGGIGQGAPRAATQRPTASPVSTAPPAPVAAPGSAGGSAAQLTWVDVGTGIGPLHLDRAGYQLVTTKGHEAVELRLVGSLTIAGVTLSLDGLGARYEFATQHVTPYLSGMGLDINRPPIRLAGSFTNADGDFSGRVVIGTPEFSLTAMGAFTMLGGTPSMFAYGVLDYPLGGPVFFFVEGLAAGFGLHRKLRLPAVQDVEKFPLIVDAISAAAPAVTLPGLPAAKAPASPTQAAGAAVAKQQSIRISDFVTPALGEHFLAVGIKFTSFKIVESFVLVVASIGHDVEVDIIGVSTIQSPPIVPAGLPAMVRLRLNLLARINLTEGFVVVVAALASDSYVYGPMCHLTGDAAFATWFAGDNAGDFVLTVGGYHPEYVPPPHYPTARRIELRFEVSDYVLLVGRSYFALTPALLMAGGSLHASVEFDSLSAWADFSVDFFVAWEPYHYNARVHVEVGAKFLCFETVASIDLAIWGPNFSGLGHVEWLVFSFDVQFGTALPLGPMPIDWAHFRTSFLPPDDAIVSGVISAGLLREVTSPSGSRVSVITPEELVVSINSAMPITFGGLGGAMSTTGGEAVGVSPMNRSDLGVSQLRITVTDEHGVIVGDRFVATEVSKAFPPALWGRTMHVDRDSLPIAATGGYVLRPAAPPVSHSTLTRRRSDFAYTPGTANQPPPGQPVFSVAVDQDPVAVLPLADLAALGLDLTAIDRVEPRLDVDGMAMPRRVLISGQVA